MLEMVMGKSPTATKSQVQYVLTMHWLDAV